MNHCLTVFLDAIKELHPSPKILNAVVEIGEGFVESPSPFSDDEYYWNFFTRGVVFNFKKQQLTQITIYCKNFENYINFPFQLFEYFSNNATNEEVIKYLGKPLEVGGDEHSKYLGYIKPWYKFKINRCFVNFDFDEEKRIQSIHITKTNKSENFYNYEK